jgi:hypothetical protein
MYFLKVIIFWDVMPCNLADNCELLRGTSYVEASGSFKMLMFVYKSSWSQFQKTVISIVNVMRTSFLLLLYLYFQILTYADFCPPFLLVYIHSPCYCCGLFHVSSLFVFFSVFFNIGLFASVHPVSFYFLEICGLLGFLRSVER